MKKTVFQSSVKLHVETSHFMQYKSNNWVLYETQRLDWYWLLRGLILIIIVHFGSSSLEVFFEKGVLGNFAKFTGKHLCKSLFLKKVAGLRQACNFIKKETLAQVFSFEFCAILRTPFLQNTSGGCFCHLKEKMIFMQKVIFL